jgi:hypothetical protein
MKKILLLLCIFSCLVINAQLVIHPKGGIKPMKAAVYSGNDSLVKLAKNAAANGIVAPIPADSFYHWSPSVGLNVFNRDNVTGTSNIGLTPGVGYGFKWTPSGHSNNTAIAVDLYAAAVVNSNNTNYFSFSLLPIITFFNWISIGYGGDAEFAINNTVKDKPIGSIFTIGISKSIGK